MSPRAATIPLLGSAFAERSVALADIDGHDGPWAARAARVFGASPLDETGPASLNGVQRPVAPNAHADRVARLVGHLVAAVPPERRSALRAHFAAHLGTLAPSFDALAGEDGPARQAAAAKLAADAPLNLLLGDMAHAQVDRDDVRTLVEALHRPEEHEHRATPLTAAQYAQVHRALDDMPAGPTSEFWQVLASGHPELAAAGPSATFRLAALLLEAAGGDDASIGPTLLALDRRLAPRRPPAD